MDSKNSEIFRDKDILGMDKPTDQLRSAKMKNGTWFLMMMFFILIICAIMVYYFK